MAKLFADAGLTDQRGNLPTKGETVRKAWNLVRREIQAAAPPTSQGGPPGRLRKQRPTDLVLPPPSPRHRQSETQDPEPPAEEDEFLTLGGTKLPKPRGR